ncbi:PaaI family thioesterase [Streptomyces sp. H39-S7]|uniref:PaaI family thioesterase n=1 Tax=Streptomyces sp. H39-S7 TaxID=3004357 RepID=UPI0022AF1BDF|nr:PaaI family thioesterase [Streptomyces sp. H39-S7]MCZ4126022.1 PaaI family thioesterase [Streptomyces sp. H39-S7]
MTVTTAEAEKILADSFAPWVRDLALAVVETGDRHAVLRLPWSGRLAREGGAMSGQALMAAADTATVIAVSAARGGYGPMTTVQQSTTFQRAVQDADVLLTARVTKLGRRLAFTDITMTAEGGEEVVAQGTTVYAFPG